MGFEEGHTATADGEAVLRIMAAWPFCHLVKRRHCAAYESLQQAHARHKRLWELWAEGNFGFSPWGLFGTVPSPACPTHFRHMKVVPNKGSNKKMNNKGKPQAYCSCKREVESGGAKKCSKMVFWDESHAVNPSIRSPSSQPSSCSLSIRV